MKQSYIDGLAPLGRRLRLMGSDTRCGKDTSAACIAMDTGIRECAGVLDIAGTCSAKMVELS